MTPRADNPTKYSPPVFSPHEKSPTSRLGEPTWDVANLFPMQGDWTEAEYLALDNGGSRIVELRDGYLEVHPAATLFHQLIALYLCRLLDDFVRSRKLPEFSVDVAAVFAAGEMPQ